MEALLWVALGVALAVAEIFTTTLMLLMVGVGALAAAGAAGLGAELPVQALVFAVVSALSLVVVRPVIRRHGLAATGGDGTAIGVEALQGAEALVLEPVDADHGVIKVDGEVWSARSFDGTETYQPGDHVRVVQVRGATVLVWREGVTGLGELRP